MTCEECNPTELLPENRQAWSLINRFEDCLKFDSSRRKFCVDYLQARCIAETCAEIPDTLTWIDELSAVARGASGRF